MDLLDLLKRPEGKTLEFKRDLSSPDGVLRSLVAFANTSGGAVLIGVEDRARHVRGVKEPLDLEERLAVAVGQLVEDRPARGIGHGLEDVTHTSECYASNYLPVKG